ncbi:MAG: metallophosphoesterase family protein [Planctomycetaceae bacterium]
MKRAIISDIHGNLEALDAVLEDITKRDIEDVVCLGDIVGYGPNPLECIDRVMQFRACVMGNHDQAALYNPLYFNSSATRAILWTRRMLEADGPLDRSKRWKFLKHLPPAVSDRDILYVHGSPRDPHNEYVFSGDVKNPMKMQHIFSLIEHVCFVGHTHIPGIFTENLSFFAPEDVDFRSAVGHEKLIVNVGSVGQPRNGNPLASYVVLDDAQFRFCRVQYDLEKTVAKIEAIPDLDDSLGYRLRHGR